MGRAQKLRQGEPPTHGDPVKVIGHCGGNLDDGSSYDLHGDSGHVVGANPHYDSKRTGERMTTIELENGAIVAVPTRTLKRD